MRTQTAEGLSHKLESVPDSAVQSKQEESRTLAEETTLSSRSEVTSLVSNPTVIAVVGQSSTRELEKPTVFSNQQPLVSTKNVHKATADTHNHFFCPCNRELIMLMLLSINLNRLAMVALQSRSV